MLYRYFRTAGLLLLGLSLTAAGAGATPVQDPSSGHYYEVVTTAFGSGPTWGEAGAAAQGSTFDGVAGHLAAITSPAEQQFVQSLLPTSGAWWIGGYQFPETLIPSANWNWVTGEPFSFTNWGTQANWGFNEPNDFNGSQEDRIMINPGGAWNDGGQAARLSGYIVEYEVATISASLALVPSNSPNGTSLIQATVSLDRPAPAEGAEVTLTSSDPILVPVPFSVTIDPGSTSKSFTIFNRCVNSPTDVTVSAAYGGVPGNAIVTLLPSAFRVIAVALDQTSVVGGTTVHATATLGAPALGGEAVTVGKEFSLNGTPVSVPPTVSVPTGASSVTFDVKTSSTSETKTVKIFVGPACPSLTVSLTVQAASQPGNGSQTPPATGGTPPSGTSAPGQSKQFQLKFLEWVTETLPVGYRRVMRFQITNAGKTTARGVTVSADGGFSQLEVPFTLEPAGTAVVRLAGGVQNSPSCGQSVKPYPVTVRVAATDLPSEQTNMTISGPPDSPGCPQK